MRRKKVVNGILYLLLIAAMGMAAFGFLAGVCCRRLEEFKTQDSSLQQAVEHNACRHATEIMGLYLSQGMGAVEAYVEAEDVSFVIQKTSGRRLGGNYREQDEPQIREQDGQPQQYIYWFLENAQGGAELTGEAAAEYFVKIAFFREEQIRASSVHLEGIPDDLRPWIKFFYAMSRLALAAAVALLVGMIGRNGPDPRRRERYAGRLFKMPLERLALWWVAAIPVLIWGYNKTYVWDIPLTVQQSGWAAVLELLGESVWEMTRWWLLLGILFTGFLLHLSLYVRLNPAGQSGIANRIFKAPRKAWERLSLFQKVMAILVPACVGEAVAMGLLQYGAAHVESLGALQSWLSGRSIWLLWFLWILEKLVLAVLALQAADSVMRLRASAEELAQGNLGCQIPLDGMTGELLEFGRDMNAISHVVAAAVEDRTRSERLKTELVTNVSHDIKTPLTSIINYADLIGRETTDNEKISEYAQVLYRQSTRLKKLIEDLMEVSKAATGNLEVYLERCQAGVLLSQAMGEFEQRLRDRGIDVVIRQRQEPVWILADPRMLWRILDNLMTNICKYAQSDTRVYLSLETQENQAVLTFKNTSSYPLDMDASELMERFVRGDRSRHTEGSGLGLSIARSLTELQGGSMQLTTDGDLFKVTLVFPIAAEETENGAAGTAGGIQARPPAH